MVRPVSQRARPAGATAAKQRPSSARGLVVASSIGSARARRIDPVWWAAMASIPLLDAVGALSNTGLIACVVLGAAFDAPGRAGQ